MAEELQLLVSSSKYENRITMLEGYLSDLRGLKDEYEELKSDASSVMEGDQLPDLQQSVEDNIKRVEKAIESTQASIDTLKETLSNMENVGANITGIIQDATDMANSLFS
jgi:prophage DNA circulation protein